MTQVQEKRRIRVSTSSSGSKTYYPERLVSYQKYKFFGPWLTKWEGLRYGSYVEHESTQQKAEQHFIDRDRDRTEEYIDVDPHVIGYHKE